MKVTQVINNNVVASTREGKEVLLMGRGIGFNQRAGLIVQQEKIEKIFKLDSPKISQEVMHLVEREGEKFLKIAEEIIRAAEETLGTKLDEMIYVLLTDHLVFATKRYHQNIQFPNPLLPEIKILYPEEFALGLQALTIIEQEFEMKLPESEAGFLALHIVNARSGATAFDTLNTTQLVHDIVTSIKEDGKLVVDEYSIEYSRLLIHLNLFADRVMKHTEYTEEVDELTSIVLRLYPDIAAYVAELAQQIEEKYNYKVHLKEHAYLILHLQRLR